MTVDAALPPVLIVIGLGIAVTMAVLVIAKFRRQRHNKSDHAIVAPYRNSLIVLASGEDQDSQAKDTLYAVPAHVWVRLRPKVLDLLPKVRGSSADDLGELMRSHGELDKARGMLISRSAVRRARAAYLLGLVRDPESVALVLPLLVDPDADVRIVAARALGLIGEPSSAGDVLGAVNRDGQIGLPTWVAAEALLGMGDQIAPVLKEGLTSADHFVRNVCVLVAGHGAFATVVPQLRILLATDTERDVRTGATVALGRIGRAEDVATLAWLTHASETTVLRRTAATALGDIGSPEGLDTLAGLLGDGDRRLAQLAADSLVRIGSGGIARLREAAIGKSPSARVAGAALTLAGLRGQLVMTAAGVR